MPISTTRSSVVGRLEQEPRRFMRGLLVGLVLASAAWAGLWASVVWLFR